MMNTIPTIFNETLPSYTAMGGNRRNTGDTAATGVTAILLNRGGRYPRRTLFAELEKAGFDRVISLEGPQDRYDLEELAERFPFVRFILLKDVLSPGEQINLGVTETASPLFFVLWNDLRFLLGGDAAKIAFWLRLSPEKLLKAPPGASPMRRLCTVPVIQNSRLEILSTIASPALYRSKLPWKLRDNLKALHFPPEVEAQPTLYPFDGVGIYDRERFIRLGGFDGTIQNPYWQFMDFGFRAYLWGDEIRCTRMIRMSCDGEAVPKDTTADSGYRRFYLRNLAPVFRKDTAHIPLRLFPGYLFKTGEDLSRAWREFRENRQWVEANSRRFQRDAHILTGLWEQESPPTGTAPS
ncbi:hypothetical protein AGMMS4952_01240 [Spirochaetia bacterium]|nr:hypothetical protein AGMMS4952_01240 [Spirochaetia bacterium]